MDRKSVFWTGLLFCASLPQFVQSVRAGGEVEQGFVRAGEQSSSKNPCCVHGKLCFSVGSDIH